MNIDFSEKLMLEKCSEHSQQEKLAGLSSYVYIVDVDTIRDILTPDIAKMIKYGYGVGLEYRPGKRIGIRIIENNVELGYNEVYSRVLMRRHVQPTVEKGPKGLDNNRIIMIPNYPVKKTLEMRESDVLPSISEGTVVYTDIRCAIVARRCVEFIPTDDIGIVTLVSAAINYSYIRLEKAQWCKCKIHHGEARFLTYFSMLPVHDGDKTVLAREDYYEKGNFNEYNTEILRNYFDLKKIMLSLQSIGYKRIHFPGDAIGLSMMIEEVLHDSGIKLTYSVHSSDKYMHLRSPMKMGSECKPIKGDLIVYSHCYRFLNDVRDHDGLVYDRQTPSMIEYMAGEKMRDWQQVRPFLYTNVDHEHYLGLSRCMNKCITSLEVERGPLTNTVLLSIGPTKIEELKGIFDKQVTFLPPSTKDVIELSKDNKYPVFFRGNYSIIDGRPSLRVGGKGLRSYHFLSFPNDLDDSLGYVENGLLVFPSRVAFFLSSIELQFAESYSLHPVMVRSGKSPPEMRYLYYVPIRNPVVLWLNADNFVILCYHHSSTMRTAARFKCGHFGHSSGVCGRWLKMQETGDYNRIMNKGPESFDVSRCLEFCFHEGCLTDHLQCRDII